MRGPQNRLIAFLQRALWGLFESRRRAALRNHYAGNIGRRRRLQSHIRRLTGRNAGLALRSHSGILKHDSIDNWRDIARQVGEADPVNSIAWSPVVDDGLPLHEPRRWCFHGSARFRIAAIPAGPLAARVFRISRAHKKFQTRFIRMTQSFCTLGRWRTPPLDAAPL